MAYYNALYNRSCFRERSHNITSAVHRIPNQVSERLTASDRTAINDKTTHAAITSFVLFWVGLR